MINAISENPENGTQSSFAVTMSPLFAEVTGTPSTKNWCSHTVAGVKHNSSIVYVTDVITLSRDSKESVNVLNSLTCVPIVIHCSLLSSPVLNCMNILSVILVLATKPERIEDATPTVKQCPLRAETSTDVTDVYSISHRPTTSVPN
mmetsp:Transcript_21955/g.24530  ORF Transcript_21955/g.24530 Transcript_21955/m.24530 type:complete len:147 (+) Transcript_21955:355-795(+)